MPVAASAAMVVLSAAHRYQHMSKAHQSCIPYLKDGGLEDRTREVVKTELESRLRQCWQHGYLAIEKQCIVVSRCSVLSAISAWFLAHAVFCDFLQPLWALRGS